MLSQKDVDELETRLRDVFTTKEEFQQFKSDIFDKLDAFFKEVKDSQDERAVMAHQISDHEDRITKLEASPKN